MLENTATPLSLKNRNRNSQHYQAQQYQQGPGYLQDNGDPQQKRLRQVQFDLSKGNSLHYLKELSTTKPRSDTSQNLLNQFNKENLLISSGSSPLLTKPKATRGVTFKDEIQATERIFEERQYLPKQSRRPPGSSQSLPAMQTYPEQFKNFTKNLDRYQSAYSNSGHYQNQEIFHEEIEKSYVEQHQQQNIETHTDSDVLSIAKSTISTSNFIRKIKHILITLAFAILTFVISSFFLTFNYVKLIKAALLISSVVALRTLTFEKQFENGMKAVSFKAIAALSLLAVFEFFCLMGFATEVFLALLPSNFQQQIYWIAPSGLVALMETIWYWSENAERRKNETLIEMKRETFQFYLACAKKYLNSSRFFKESFICMLSSAIIVTIFLNIEATTSYLTRRISHSQNFYSRSYTSEEAHLLLNPHTATMPTEYDSYLYIGLITIFTRAILALILTLNYHLLRFSVSEYLGKYICYQPLYTIIFAYPQVFSDCVQYEAIKYWYTYQTIPLSQVIERTQFSANLTDSESKVIDTIFNFIGKEINSVLIELSLHEGEQFGDESSNQNLRELKSYFIKDRKMEALLHKQRFLQTVLKFTLVTISHSASVFNTRIIDFLHSISASLDQLLQVFEKQSNYYTAEIADIIVLKKEIVSNLQYIFTKMNSTFKTSGISPLTLALISDADHIYNEYDLHSKFSF